MTRRSSSYVTRPTVALPPGATVHQGTAVWSAVADAVAALDRPVVVVDAYPGADVDAITAAARDALPGWGVVDAEERTALPTDALDALVGPALTDDRVFGVLSHFDVEQFLDPAGVRRLRSEVGDRTAPVLVVGWGAARILPDADLLVLADMARWELQRRQRAGAANWHAANGDEDALRKYKRGFFVEWRTADDHKQTLLGRVDLVIDTNRGVDDVTAVEGGAFRAALRTASRSPFRPVPFFDPGVWGGQWMKEHLGLDPDVPNYAWCFDCVPEENSLLLAPTVGPAHDADADAVPVVEVPAMDLVLAEPRALLGERTFARFGAEFPIRFDFLDTMGGGNLSLQVHPLTDYIQRTFGMHYTQDESYYMLDAGPAATVYLGVKEGVDAAAMADDLRVAAAGGEPFDAERYVNRFPAAKHDHFAIPAGTVHCSGVDSMVLEISATPFIFTFKLGLGACRPRRHPAARAPGPRTREHPVGARHRLGARPPGRPGRGPAG
ncbi:class I mannose-6-phosphate isomerase [Curtobacterium flaccumfaciens]|nr:class I mannose-6-phosphate isomerase [Curtobacterium flaccumfaciens]